MNATKRFAFILIIIYYLLYPSLSLEGEDDISYEKELRGLEKEIANHFKMKKYKSMEIKKLESILTDLKVSSPIENRFQTDKTLCGVCRLLMRHIKEKKLAIRVIGEGICNAYIALSTWTITSFCSDLIKINLPILEFILEHSEIFEPELACSILLQNEHCYVTKPALAWRSAVPSRKLMKIPQVNHDPNAKPLKILHLTDLHITPDYEVNGVSNCGYPVCCKKGLGSPLKSEKAGTWGDYNCDVPLWLFGNVLNHINHTHKDIDLVYFTGDIIDHTIWKASKENNIQLISFIFRTLYETFPNITVLPILGNHESLPLNGYAPSHPAIEISGFSTQWLYTLVSKLWAPWLPSKALKTVKKQGYYSYTVNSKFKIIALNNNVCYNLNWWVLYDTTFLIEQLDFLRQELEQAEANGQFIHIITHVPVGNQECIEPWEVNYNALIRRFSHIIKGQFYGHTHTDELKIFYDETHTKPINIGYNGASLTPYIKYNPNYKIMTVDPNTYGILDIDTYIFNLTDANQHPERTPSWFKLYSMKDAYNLANFSPAKFDELAVEMFKNETLFNLYWRYYVRDGDPSLIDGCDKKCKKEIFCKIVTTQSLSPDKIECL